MSADQPEGTSPHVEYYPFPVKTSLPFSAAVRVGNLLFVSGQMGTNEKMELIPGGIEKETKQAFANIKAILESHGSSLERVVRIHVVLADIADMAEMDRVYREFFPVDPPARTAWSMQLRFGNGCEIECIALAGR